MLCATLARSQGQGGIAEMVSPLLRKRTKGGDTGKLSHISLTACLAWVFKPRKPADSHSFGEDLTGHLARNVPHVDWTLWPLPPRIWPCYVGSFRARSSSPF